MSRVVFPAGSTGEAVAYIKALTGQAVSVPSGPQPTDLGEVLLVKTKFVSVAASTNIGFSFGEIGGSTDVKVLLQDYWFMKEVLGDSNPVNSWTFAAGFRVGIRIVAFDAKMNISLGMLAAKAEMEGLNAQIQILRVGMPNGPNVPGPVAFPDTFDVNKFGELKKWEGAIIGYAAEHRADLSPVLVSASINIDGERLLQDAPGVRYALWRILDGETLGAALALLAAGKAPRVGAGEVRSVYATVFNDPTMVVPGQPSEEREPRDAEKEQAEEWLTGYKDL